MLLRDILDGSTGGEALPREAAADALAYLRVSTAAQEDAGLSLPAQRKEIEDYAAGRGIAIRRFYQDAQSGFQDDERRVEFWRMIEDAKAEPDISLILVHDFSRFYRDPYKCPAVKGELRACGVRVVSVTEPDFDPDTIPGLWLEKVTEAKNATYSMEVAFHTKKCMCENVTRRDPELGWCYKNGGKPLWGYRGRRVERGTDRRGKPLARTVWELDDTEVAGRPLCEWVRHCLVELRGGQRYSIGKLCEFLNELGIRSPRGGYWSTATWYQLLEEDSLLQYAGFGVWNTHARHGRRRPSSEWIIVEKAHPALITMEEAEAIQAVRTANRALPPSARLFEGRVRKSPFLLSGGLFVCKGCDSNMVGFHVRDRGFYACGSTVYRKGLGCTAEPGQPARRRRTRVEKGVIENAVLDAIRERFAEWTDVKRFSKWLSEELRGLRQEQATATVELGKRLAAQEKKIANLVAVIGQGDFKGVEEVRAGLAQAADEKERMEAELAGVRAEPPAPEIDPDAVRAWMADFQQIIAKGTNEERRQIVRCFVKRIEWDPASKEITLILYGLPPQRTRVANSSWWRKLTCRRNVLRVGRGGRFRCWVVFLPSRVQAPPGPSRSPPPRLSHVRLPFAPRPPRTSDSPARPTRPGSYPSRGCLSHSNHAA